MNARQQAPNSQGMVTVVGLGAMGGAVAGHLVAAGYEVNGYDPNPEAGRRATTNGVTIFDDTATAVAQSGFVITSLPDPAAVRSAWEGDRGIIASVAAGRGSGRAQYHRSRHHGLRRGLSPASRSSGH